MYYENVVRHITPFYSESPHRLHLRHLTYWCEARAPGMATSLRRDASTVNSTRDYSRYRLNVHTVGNAQPTWTDRWWQTLRVGIVMVTMIVRVGVTMPGYTIKSLPGNPRGNTPVDRYARMRVLTRKSTLVKLQLVFVRLSRVLDSLHATVVISYLSCLCMD